MGSLQRPALPGRPLFVAGFGVWRRTRASPVIGPIVLVVGGLVAGALAGGAAGAVVGGSMGAFLVAAVVFLSVAWSRQVGSQIDAETAYELAPRPPGFKGLCDFVYERTIR